MTRLEEITERKRQLLARADAERNALIRTCCEYRARTLVASKVSGFIKNPIVLAGLGLLALKMPWRRTLKMSGWIWRGWRLLKTVQRFAL